MSYTKGPWKVSKNGSVEGNDHTQVATFIDNSDYLALIAAAPDLVEALESVKAEYEDGLGISLHENYQSKRDQRRQKQLQGIVTAITKAKGGKL